MQDTCVDVAWFVWRSRRGWKQAEAATGWGPTRLADGREGGLVRHGERTQCVRWCVGGANGVGRTHLGYHLGGNECWLASTYTAATGTAGARLLLILICWLFRTP
eukprot:354542-Chlamydomonas_euryale.AAC.3